jgi:PAS domain S-box-containing protein
MCAVHALRVNTRMAERIRQRPAPRNVGSRSFGQHDILRLVDRASDVVYRWRLHPPGFDFVNQAVFRLTGYTPDELYRDPASMVRIVHPNDRPIVHQMLARGTGRVPVIVRWIRKDGSITWVEQRTTAVYNRRHELVAIEGIVREIADPTSGAGPNVRVVGDLRIDLDRARVLIGGREVHLTPSEFRLIVLLTDQPGRVVSRATIIEALWSSAHAGNARSCEVHISKLRTKIERGDRGPERIETVRGEGYRFIPSG